jgi:hypothetical protein
MDEGYRSPSTPMICSEHSEGYKLLISGRTISKLRPLTASILVVVVILVIASICSDYRAVTAEISTYIEYSSILKTISLLL